MKVTVTSFIVLALFTLNSFAQEYTRWHLPEGARARLGKGTVNGITYSPDGARIAVATTIGIWLYDAETFKEEALLIGHPGRVKSVAFSQDGGMLASGGEGEDMTVQLWNATTGEHLRTLTGHTEKVSSVAFSPDGKTLASASWDETVRLWNTETGEHLRTLKGHTGLVDSIAFSPDGSTIASTGGYRDETVRLWDVNTGQNLWTRAGHSPGVTFVAFSADGSTLVSGGSDGIRRWDAATGQLLSKSLEYGGTLVSAYNVKKNIVAMGDIPGSVGLWDATTDQFLRVFRGHRTHITTLAFSPDGGRLVSASAGGTLRLWDTETGEQKHVCSEHTDGTTGLAFSEDSRMIASASNGKIFLWDANTGIRLRAFSERWKYVYSVAFSQESGIIAGGSDGEIQLWDVNTGELLSTLTGHPGEYLSLAFSPNGRLLASGGGSTVLLWDVGTGELLHTLPWHIDEITSLAFSRDGELLAVASKDRSVTLWDVGAGERQHTLTGHNDEVVSVAFSRDGRVFTSATSRALILWTTVTWTKLHTLAGDAYGNSSVAFSLDSRTIARGGLGSTVRLWNTATGELENSFTGHSPIVTSMAFSPDGRTLATGVLDGPVLLWDVVPSPAVSSTVSITPTVATSPRVGEQLTLSLDIAAGEDVVGYQASVHFDSTALRYVESAIGDYLPEGSFFVPPVFEGNRVTLGGTAFAGVSTGDGTLATLTFEVLVVKPSRLTLFNVYVVNSKGERGYPGIVDGQVIEPPPLAGDANGDGVVNILDLVLVAANIGETGENDADVNGDGVVNILDLVQIAGAIGGAEVVEPPPPVEDVNGDGEVNILDLVQVAANLGKIGENDADVNGDGVVNILDLVQVAGAIGGGGAAPSAYSLDLSIISAADVAGWLAQAQGLGVGDANLERGIHFLEQLLAALMPDETVLLQNYPNPFNPETWIPYRLAEGAEVEIAIYDAKGTPVRQLALGYQAAGYYADRGRAAYWDGRNENGEPVASGVYFYRLQAGDYAAMGRMVVVK